MFASASPSRVPPCSGGRHLISSKNESFAIEGKSVVVFDCEQLNTALRSSQVKIYEHAIFSAYKHDKFGHVSQRGNSLDYHGMTHSGIRQNRGSTNFIEVEKVA